MAHTNKFIFEKVLLEIEKVVKIFSIFNKFFFKIGLLFNAFRAYISKIHYEKIVVR